MTTTLPANDPQAESLVAAIQHGDLTALDQLLQRTPALAAVRIVDAGGVSRTTLHIAADWPGHFPNAPQVVTMLIRAGAPVNAPVAHSGSGGAPETALHWAASSNDVGVLDALLDGGADIEARGAVFTGGTAMSDAVVFAQWDAARRLLARGASTTIWQAAALGVLERVVASCDGTPSPSSHDITNAFWHACRGGQRDTAEYLLRRGADCNWVGHDHTTALDAAAAGGHEALVEWLQGVGAVRAADRTDARE